VLVFCVFSGIVSSVFTQNGEGFYLISPSEMSRFSVSAHVVTRPCCVIRHHVMTQEPSHHRSSQSNQRRSSPSARTTPANHHTQSPRFFTRSFHPCIISTVFLVYFVVQLLFGYFIFSWSALVN